MRRALCVALVALAAAPAAHSATPWQRVSGPTLPGPQLGLWRDKYGTLSVAWQQGKPATINVTRLDETGTATGSSTVTSNFDGLAGLALIGMPDGSLRLFAAGGIERGVRGDGINSFTSPPGGTTWTFDSNGPFGGAVANAAAEVGATLAGNGWIVTTWGGAIVHIGVKPSDGDPSYQQDLGCCGAEPQLVTQADGSVVLAWITNSSSAVGTVVREILPTPEAQFLLPSGVNAGSFGLAAGSSGGSYVAYVEPAKQRVQLYRYQGGVPLTLATGAFSVAKVFAGPGGRMWVMWGSSDGGIDVTRSDEAVQHFEPVQHIAFPAGTFGFYNAQGEGSRGPLDLFADLAIVPNDRGFWRTHVDPQLTVTAKASVQEIVTHPDGSAKDHKAHVGRLTFVVTDAGDPVNGVHISYGAASEGVHITTNHIGVAHGKLALDKSGHIPPGLKLKVRVERTGYPLTTIVVTGQ